MNKILIILSFVVLASCAPNEVPNEVPYKTLVERQGVTYEVNSQTPFTGISVSHHDNGQLEVKGYKDGKGNGLQEMYYENGQLESKSNWKDGIANGLQEVYYENGQLSFKSNYKDGKQTDTQTFTLRG